MSSSAGRLRQRAQQREIAEILWFLRTTPWRQLLHMTWTLKRMSRENFTRRLQSTGFTPKGSR